MSSIHGRLTETEILFAPDIEPAAYQRQVMAIVNPQSRFVIEAGHFGGLLELSRDLYLAAILPRPTPNPQSRIMDATLDGFTALEAMAEDQHLQYTPLPSYKVANRMFGNGHLDSRTRLHSADFLRERADRINQRIGETLAQAEYQDDHLSYTAENVVESLFDNLHALKVLLPRTRMLLDMSRNHLSKIDHRGHLDLVHNFNRGVSYLVDACSSGADEQEQAQIIFDNIQHTICQLHHSQDLSPRNRLAVERLTQRIAAELQATLSHFPPDAFNAGADAEQFIVSFADYRCLDGYVPGLTARLSQRRDMQQSVAGR